MIDWKTPEFSDKEWVKKAVHGTDYLGSDSAFASIYLLRNKYNLKIANCDGILLREYDGPYGRKGYAFPLGHGDIKKALDLLSQDAEKSGKPVTLFFLTESHKDLLEELYPGRFDFAISEGDMDYVYLTEPLSKLSGRKLHKHKNHYHRYERIYGEPDILPLDDITREDALKVANGWYAEHEEDQSIIYERASLYEAMDCIQELELSGIVLYADGIPCAMSVVSDINDNIYDIHYEKAVGEYAANGAYSVICSRMAKELTHIQYVNREEDLDLPGLRQSKLSYRPAIMYQKYRAIEK